MLARLRGWRPAVPVGWAHHNYADVKHGVQADGRWRVERLLQLQAANGWPPGVWLTEGGYQFDVRHAGPEPWRYVLDPALPGAPAEQAVKLAANWSAMARLPVRLWTQYQVNDADVRFQSALRGPIAGGPSGGPLPHDPPYPAYALWPMLGA